MSSAQSHHQRGGRRQRPCIPTCSLIERGKRHPQPGCLKGGRGI